jgi:hypothetical protein
MKNTLLAFFLVTFILTPFAYSQSTPSPQQVAKVQRLISLSGGYEIQKVSDQLKDQLITSIKPSYPKISASQWNQIKANMTTEELEVMTARAYLKHYSEQEIDQLIAFYQSDLGQKMQKSLPALQKDLELAARMWSKKQLEIVGQSVPTS